VVWRCGQLQDPSKGLDSGKFWKIRAWFSKFRHVLNTWTIKPNLSDDDLHKSSFAYFRAFCLMIIIRGCNQALMMIKFANPLLSTHQILVMEPQNIRNWWWNLKINLRSEPCHPYGTQNSLFGRGSFSRSTFTVAVTIKIYSVYCSEIRFYRLKANIFCYCLHSLSSV
jgi:hypothetical protein